MGAVLIGSAYSWIPKLAKLHLGLHASEGLPMQAGAVRGLCYVREHCLQSGSSDGSVHVWDVRYPQQALHSLRMPDSG